MTLPPPLPIQERPQSEAVGGALRTAALTLLVLGFATAAVVCALQSRNGHGPTGQLRYDDGSIQPVFASAAVLLAVAPLVGLIVVRNRRRLSFAAALTLMAIAAVALLIVWFIVFGLQYEST